MKIKYLLPIILLCLLFVAFTGLALENNEQRATMKKGVQSQEVAINGRVVYHRPGGIFLSDLSGKSPTLLAKNGTYARWSPDGKAIVFLRGNQIMLYHLDSKKETKLAQARKSRAVCFAEKGKAVLFTDGKLLKRVELDTLRTSTLLDKGRYLEIDMSHDGQLIAATMKALGGYKVVVFSYPELKGHKISRGCSTSLSPDGRYVTVNDLNHKNLHIFNIKTLKKHRVPTPPDMRFDDQFWSNHPDWLVSSSDGDFSDIFIHHVRNGTTKRVTFTGDCNRADLFITSNSIQK